MSPVFTDAPTVDLNRIEQLDPVALRKGFEALLNQIADLRAQFPASEARTRARGQTAIRSLTFSDSPYPVQALDEMLLVDATGGAVVILLPSAPAVPLGRHLAIKKTDASGNAAVITPNGVEVIDGTAAAVSITVRYTTVKIQSDQVAWWTR